MDEIVKLVSKKAGISESQAQMAVETVAGYLKDNLPSPLAEQVDGALKGDISSSSVSDLTKGIGGMFGKK